VCYRSEKMIKENRYYKCCNYIGKSARYIYVPVVVVDKRIFNNNIVISNTCYVMLVFWRLLYRDRKMDARMYVSRALSNIITLIILIRR
jgi:hypothetical protein